jgi:hypothetical protein
MARKHVHAPQHRNAVPTESHSVGSNTGYFLRTLWTVRLALSSNEPLLFIGIPSCYVETCTFGVYMW